MPKELTNNSRIKCNNAMPHLNFVSKRLPPFILVRKNVSFLNQIGNKNTFDCTSHLEKSVSPVAVWSWPSLRAHRMELLWVSPPYSCHQVLLWLVCQKGIESSRRCMARGPDGQGNLKVYKPLTLQSERGSSLPRASVAFAK